MELMGENVVLVALDREVAQCWIEGDNETLDAERSIQDTVDAALEVDPDELIARIARALYDFDGGERWHVLEREVRESYYGAARAAIACLSRSDGKGDSR